MFKYTTINLIILFVIVFICVHKIFLFNADSIYNSFKFLIVLVKSYIKSFSKSNECKIVDNYILCKVKEFQYFINPEESLVTMPIKAGYNWEGYLHQYFSKYKNLKGIALDIGANIGTHTLYLSKYFKEVYAFESQRDMFKQLKLNLKINNINNVKTFNAKPSAYKEILFCKRENSEKIEQFDNLIGEIKISNQDGINDGECQKIVIKKIDSLKLKSKVSLIKMDYNFDDVLKGAIKTIKKNKPIIIFKEADFTNSVIFKELRKLNYSIKRISIFSDWIAYPN
jgi:FkbM family methyltransferase